MIWNYRVVKKHDRVGIHGVYYDDAGGIRSIDENPSTLCDETFDGLRSRWQLMREALNQEIIDFETFQPISNAGEPGVEFLWQEEAWQVARDSPDAITRQMVEAALVSALAHTPAAGELPGVDFDLHYFAKAIRRFCSNHKFIQAILNGEDISWP
jgi:hypothetical protein